MMSCFFKEELFGTCSQKASIPLFTITSTWAGISAPLYTLEHTTNGSPGSPCFVWSKNPHRRWNMSSDELLKAGQHEDRLLDPHVTFDGHTVWGFISVPTGFWTSPLQPCCKNLLCTLQKVQVVALVAELWFTKLKGDERHTENVKRYRYVKIN